MRDVFQEAFKLWHIGGCEVAVLEKHPLAIFDGILNVQRGLWSLALSEGYLLEVLVTSLAFLPCHVVDFNTWIGTC